MASSGPHADGKGRKPKAATLKEQSERFKQTAKDVEADETGELFNQALDRLVPVQKQREKPPKG